MSWDASELYLLPASCKDVRHSRIVPDIGLRIQQPPLTEDTRGNALKSLRKLDVNLTVDFCPAALGFIGA